MTTPHQPQPHTDGWQDISTVAPGRVMVTDGLFFGVGSSLEGGRYISWNNFFEPFDAAHTLWNKPNCIIATHWQYLPKPPSTTQSNDGEIDNV